jgi:hypothetical protein
MKEGDPAAGCRASAAASLLAIISLQIAARWFAAAAALALFALAAMTAPALAHGRLGAAEGRCRLFIGPDWMNFTGYLPDSSKNEFCEDIPATGHMIMTLDAEQPELREMPIEIRIVKDVGGEEKENSDLDAVTVAHRDPRLYPTGTVNFEHVFKEPGYFVGIVTVTGEHGEKWVSRFPFSVAKTNMRQMPYYVLLGLGVLFGFWIYMKHRPVAAMSSTGGTKPPIGPAATPAE